MQPFAFHPELFEVCANIRHALAAHGIAWFADYAAVDAIHDDFGVEVCGIHDEHTARRIHALLSPLLPGMPQSSCFLNEVNRVEPGWVVEFVRQKSQPPIEDWT